MADDPKPYIQHSPGDLITAEDWNGVQVNVQKDIAKKIDEAIKKKQDVEHSTNSDKVGGKTVDELTKSILDLVFAQLPKRTGYMQVFCNLHLNNDKIIQHKLKSYPITDIYRLEYFPVVCAKSESDARAEWVQFYLYHGDEPRLRLPGNTTPIEIETKPRFRILWKTLIDQLVDQKLLSYTDDTTLDDLDTDFWQALFSPPNDEFDPDSYCHSPWFEKCCGEKRSVGDLRKHGDWDDIYLKVKPHKTVNYPLVRPATSPSATEVIYTVKTVGPQATEVTPEPTNIRVSQLDQDSIALRLLAPPAYPGWLGSVSGGGSGGATGGLNILPLPAGYEQREQVMVLLKV
ncbi:MAG: hypothetical protein WCE79_13040 [Xanthobacteraceae bacterium]